MVVLSEEKHQRDHGSSADEQFRPKGHATRIRFS
jgi:hypothetical protein